MKIIKPALKNYVQCSSCWWPSSSNVVAIIVLILAILL